MDHEETYEYLERIANLIRSDVRRMGTGNRLLPVQVEALHYLSRCNRYSDTPQSVADFLGLTKGTVSQSLSVLESNGLIEKRVDVRDRRVVHLVLTTSGRQTVAEAVPPEVFRTAMESLPETDAEAARRSLKLLLRCLQQANGLRTFGACETCRHHRVEQGGNRRCGLTGEPLTVFDAAKICREHEAPTPSGLPAGTV